MSDGIIPHASCPSWRSGASKAASCTRRVDVCTRSWSLRQPPLAVVLHKNFMNSASRCGPRFEHLSPRRPALHAFTERPVTWRNQLEPLHELPVLAQRAQGYPFWRGLSVMYTHLSRHVGNGIVFSVCSNGRDPLWPPHLGQRRRGRIPLELYKHVWRTKGGSQGVEENVTHSLRRCVGLNTFALLMMSMRLGALQLSCPPHAVHCFFLFLPESASLFRDLPDVAFCWESMTVRAVIGQRDTLSFTHVHYPPQELCAFRQDFFDHDERHLLRLHLLDAFIQGVNLPPFPSKACPLLLLVRCWQACPFHGCSNLVVGQVEFRCSPASLQTVLLGARRSFVRLFCQLNGLQPLACINCHHSILSFCPCEVSLEPSSLVLALCASLPLPFCPRVAAPLTLAAIICGGPSIR